MVKDVPDEKKGGAHETFYLLLKRDGVPPNMVMDGSKEQSLGYFRKKCQEADLYLKQTELYSICQLQDEGTTRELKKDASRKIVRASAPKQIWDYALEFEDYVRSHTAMDFYLLQGGVSETVMSGGTYDISQFLNTVFMIGLCLGSIA